MPGGRARSLDPGPRVVPGSWPGGVLVVPLRWRTTATASHQLTVCTGSVAAAGDTPSYPAVDEWFPITARHSPCVTSVVPIQ